MTKVTIDNIEIELNPTEEERHGEEKKPLDLKDPETQKQFLDNHF